MPALIVAALAAGALLAAQGPILTRVAAHAGGPIQAGMIAFASGLAALGAAGLLAGAPPPGPAALARMPLWLWASGLIGTALMLLTMHAVPRIGVAPFVASVLCGQILAALAYDHLGAFGMAPRPVAPRQILGAALLLAGLALVTLAPAEASR